MNELVPIFKWSSLRPPHPPHPDDVVHVTCEPITCRAGTVEIPARSRWAPQHLWSNTFLHLRHANIIKTLRCKISTLVDGRLLTSKWKVWCAGTQSKSKSDLKQWQIFHLIIWPWKIPVINGVILKMVLVGGKRVLIELSKILQLFRYKCTQVKHFWSVAHLLTTITMIMMVNDDSVIILADNPACLLITRGPCNIDWRRKMQWAQSEYTIQPSERSENRQKTKPNWKRDQRKAKLQLNCLDLVILILLSLPFKEHVMKISWRWMVRWARQLLEGGRGEGRRAKGGDWRGLKKTSLEKLVICPIKIRAWFRGS